MSNDSSNDAGDFFAPPPFKADEALVDLRRRIRELPSLAERHTAALTQFDLNGSCVIELQAAPAQINAKLAKRPARTPEWEARALKSGAEVRSFIEEVKRRLTHWDDE